MLIIGITGTNAFGKVKQNFKKCIDMADIVIGNSGSIRDLRREIETEIYTYISTNEL